MPEEKVVLTEKELDAVQRLADKYGLTPEDVIDTIVLAALARGDALPVERPQS